MSQAAAVWVNGTRVSADGLHLSARDRGFTLADGLFETMLVRAGRPFRLDAHLARLSRGLAALGFPSVPCVRDLVMTAVGTAADVVSKADMSLRVTVSRGVGAGGLAPPADTRPTVVVTLAAMPQAPAALRAAGLSACVPTGRRNEHSATAGLKTLAYTDSVAALIEATRAGADEAIFLDTEGHCSEATASNLFIWNGAALVTPPLSCGVLAGITRAGVMEVAVRAGLAVEERVCALDELRGAQEAFLTSSLRGVAPLVRLDGHPIGGGTPGPRTSELTRAYEALVTDECAW